MSDPAPPAMSALQDIDGNYSSKRLCMAIALGAIVVTTLVLLALLVIATLAGKTIPDVPLLKEIMDVLEWIVIGSIGGAVAERWQPRNR